MPWQNLDLSCARTAENIAAEAHKLKLTKQQAEGVVTNAASVLSHQGPGAFFLYLNTKGPHLPKRGVPTISEIEQWVEWISRNAYKLLQEKCDVTAIRPRSLLQLLVCCHLTWTL